VKALWSDGDVQVQEYIEVAQPGVNLENTFGDIFRPGDEISSAHTTNGFELRPDGLLYSNVEALRHSLESVNKIKVNVKIIIKKLKALASGFSRYYLDQTVEGRHSLSHVAAIKVIKQKKASAQAVGRAGHVHLLPEQAPEAAMRTPMQPGKRARKAAGGSGPTQNKFADSCSLCSHSSYCNVHRASKAKVQTKLVSDSQQLSPGTLVENAEQMEEELLVKMEARCKEAKAGLKRTELPGSRMQDRASKSHATVRPPSFAARANSQEITIIYDFETTGRKALEDRVVQLGAIVTSGTQSSTLKQLVNPQGRKLNFHAQQVNGIRMGDLKGQPVFKEAWAQLNQVVTSMAAAGAATTIRLIGHNSNAFDDMMLVAELTRSGLDPATPFTTPNLVSVTVGDTMQAARRAQRDKTLAFQEYNLAGLYEHFTGTKLVGAHDALADCRGVQAIMGHLPLEYTSWCEQLVHYNRRQSSCKSAKVSAKAPANPPAPAPTPKAANGTQLKRCKCGSMEHSRTNHRDCRLHKGKQGQVQEQVQGQVQVQERRGDDGGRRKGCATQREVMRALLFSEQHTIKVDGDRGLLSLLARLASRSKHGPYRSYRRAHFKAAIESMSQQCVIQVTSGWVTVHPSIQTKFVKQVNNLKHGERAPLFYTVLKRRVVHSNAFTPATCRGASQILAGHGGTDAVHVTRGKHGMREVRMTPAQIKATLADGKWLSDETMEFYLTMLCDYSATNQVPIKIAMQNSFFYTKLAAAMAERGFNNLQWYEDIKKWTNDIKYDSVDCLVVPVSCSLHWKLVVVNMKEMRFDYYDPYGAPDTCGHVQRVSKWFTHECKKRDLQWSPGVWQIQWHEPRPSQHPLNWTDCGMFVLYYTRCIMQGIDMGKLPFRQEDMQFLRRKTALELMNGLQGLPDNQ
jgi:DNA polymerase III epsilon subunit-like protein